MGNPLNEIYEEMSKSGYDLLNWQMDLFVEKNTMTESIIEKYRDKTDQYGKKPDIGEYTNKKGTTFYIVYHGYKPWYDKIKEIVASGKNPVLEMPGRYRNEAFSDGSFYVTMEQYEQKL